MRKIQELFLPFKNKLIGGKLLYNLCWVSAIQQCESVMITFISCLYVTIYVYIYTRTWCWERLRARGEGDDRGWDGWMASSTQWTWVWVNSGSWWWTGRPAVLWFMGSQRVGHDSEQLNWNDIYISPPSWTFPTFSHVPHPGYHRALGWAACLFSNCPLAMHLMHNSVCVSTPLSHFVLTSPSPAVSISPSSTGFTGTVFPDSICIC